MKSTLFAFLPRPVSSQTTRVSSITKVYFQITYKTYLSRSLHETCYFLSLNTILQCNHKVTHAVRYSAMLHTQKHTFEDPFMKNRSMRSHIWPTMTMVVYVVFQETLPRSGVRHILSSKRVTADKNLVISNIQMQMICQCPDVSAYLDNVIDVYTMSRHIFGMPMVFSWHHCIH